MTSLVGTPHTSTSLEDQHILIEQSVISPLTLISLPYSRKFLRDESFTDFASNDSFVIT